MPKRPLTIRELALKLKDYGVISLKGGRGKGSERILLKPIAPDSKQGPQYSIKDHGDSTEISKPVLDAVLRRFAIDPDDFWREPKKKESKKK